MDQDSLASIERCPYHLSHERDPFKKGKAATICDCSLFAVEIDVKQQPLFDARGIRAIPTTRVYD
jgi:hypothetical protein